MTKPAKTPEEKAAFKKKMADAKAAKAANLAAGVSTVVVEKSSKKKPKPSAPAAPKAPGEQPKKKPWHEDNLL